MQVAAAQVTVRGHVRNARTGEPVAGATVAVVGTRLGAIADSTGKPGLSWRVAILPYLEQDTLYKQFKLDEPWDSPHNKKLIRQMPGRQRQHHARERAGAALDRHTAAHGEVQTPLRCADRAQLAVHGLDPATLPLLPDPEALTVDLNGPAHRRLAALPARETHQQLDDLLVHTATLASGGAATGRFSPTDRRAREPASRTARP